MYYYFRIVYSGKNLYLPILSIEKCISILTHRQDNNPFSILIDFSSFFHSNYEEALYDFTANYAVIISANVDEIGCGAVTCGELGNTKTYLVCLYGPYTFVENQPFYKVHVPSKILEQPIPKPCPTPEPCPTSTPATQTTPETCPTPEPCPLATAPKPSHAPATSETTLARQKFSHVDSHIFSKVCPEPTPATTTTPETCPTPESCPETTTPKSSHAPATCETTLAWRKFSHIDSHIFS